ncbi:MAG: hypothetical protein FWE67_09105 [Planctomycetaceae bacterium]|nr:hypothetical protein [Planctomycetaceae bacterium]
MLKSIIGIIRKLPQLHSIAGELHSAAKELNKETRIHYLTLLLDMGLLRLRHICPNEYKDYRFYDKSRAARNRFLTEYCRGKMDVAFNQKYGHECRAAMSNKQIFNKLFSDFLGRQWLYTPDASDQQIEEFLSTHKQIIVKPSAAGRGIGVRKILYSEVSDIKVFCEEARNNCLLLEEIVVQHPDLSSINPSSVNTLRINTVVDRTGVPHILRPALRMGVGESITDNFSGNGIVAGIDLDTGILSTPAIGADLRTYIKHPTSGVVILGFQIPHWEAAKDMVHRAANLTPQTRWVGWDIAITSKGPLVIEGNIDTGSRTMQMTTQTGVYHIMRSYL